MAPKQNDPQIEMLRNDLKKLIKNGKKKDGWDKLSIISSLISSILVVTIGSLFTYYYQSKQDAKQLQIQMHQAKLQELDCVGKLMPYLTSDDDRIKKVSFLTLNKLASTEIAAGANFPVKSMVITFMSVQFRVCLWSLLLTPAIQLITLSTCREKGPILSR